MVVEVVARALTKHALNVHCGHDDVYGALDVGWIILFAKDAQQLQLWARSQIHRAQAADQALIIRRVTELRLTPAMNVQDGFLTSHLERTFYRHESELIRDYGYDQPSSPLAALGVPRRPRRHHRVPDRGAADTVRPDPPPRPAHDRPGQPGAPRPGPEPGALHAGRLEVARRNNFVEPILGFLEEAHEEFGRLTGRYYGLVTEYKTDDADTVFLEREDDILDQQRYYEFTHFSDNLMTDAEINDAARLDPRPRRREDGLASVRGCAGQPPATRHRAGLL